MADELILIYAELIKKTINKITNIYKTLYN